MGLRWRLAVRAANFTVATQGETLHSADPFAVGPSCDTHSRQKGVSDAGHQLCASQRGNQHLIREARYRGLLHSDMHGPIGPVAQASRLRVPVSTQWSLRTPPTAVIETELTGCFTPPTATACHFRWSASFLTPCSARRGWQRLPPQRDFPHHRTLSTSSGKALRCSA